jgi:hypothetical protein
MRYLLEHIENPEILDIAGVNELTMNDKQFSLAVKGLRMKAKNREIARRILVNNEPRKKVMQDTGISNQQLSAMLNRIIKNLKEQLRRHNLVYSEYILPEKLKPVIDAVEEEHLNQYIKDLKKKK